MSVSNKQNKYFKPRPLSLLLASVIVIFVAEALVMFLISFFEVSDTLVLGLLDASLLSLFVVPTLYLLLFRPMQKTIVSLDKSQAIQQRLKELDDLKSQFIYIAAHELCSPVSTITGFTELLLSGVNPDQQKKYLKYILGRTEALERIIGDLEVVRILETGENLNIQKENHNLVNTVVNVVKTHQEQLPNKPFHVEVPSGPVVLKFDETRIIQVLDNVISNAIKYSNDIHDPIDVLLLDQDRTVKIVIRDEGIGMTDEELKSIYNKFFRAQTEKSDVVGGLGLGMAIVKNIIDGHDGEIEISSQRKVGTTVTITLPK